MGSKIILCLHFFLQILVFTQSCTAEINSFEDNITAQILSGKVRGKAGQSKNDRTFYSFKGIPFAKPPVGELRFKSPEPPEPWKDIRDAYEDGPMCMQKNYLYLRDPPVEGKEDCLYINVHTPKLSKDSSPSLLPVMVFIHYGGFFAGSGNSDYLGPEYLMDEDVVLVTFNYRLGVFGFLSTNDDVAPGNWALKDQLAALKWVQKNIASFNGDKNRVTIFGQSAGAGSVHYHLLSPATKNLFHGAITQSGSALALWAKPLGPIQAIVARMTANNLNCSSDNNSVMINCLRGVDAEVLAESVQSFKYFSNEPFVIYGPVLEKKTPLNPNPYITEEPLDIIQNKKFHNVPWITGVVTDEGILKAASLVRQESTLKTFNKNFKAYPKEMLGLKFSVDESTTDALWNNISSYFIGQNSIDPNIPSTVQGLIDIYSDRSFYQSQYMSALLHAKKGHNQVWFYHFDYRGYYTYGDYFAATKETVPFEWGVSHSDDLLYLFTASKYFPRLTAKNDILMTEIMIKLWTNFAKYKNPTPSSDDLYPLWLPIPNIENQDVVTNKNLIYLNITGSHLSNTKPSLKMCNSFYPERVKYWQSLPLKENIAGIE